MCVSLLVVHSLEASPLSPASLHNFPLLFRLSGLVTFCLKDVVEKRLLQHDEGLTGDLGVTGPFNSDDTFRVAITVADKRACASSFLC